MAGFAGGRRGRLVPPGMPRLDRRHPLAQGLVACYLPATAPSGPIRNLAGTGGDLTTRGNGGLLLGPEGPALNGQAAGQDYAYGAAPAAYQFAIGVSLFVRGRYLSTPSSGGILIGLTYDNAGTSPFDGYAVTNTTAGLEGAFNLGGTGAYLGGVTFTAGTMVSAALSLAPSLHVYYLNGAANATDTGAGSIAYGTSPFLCFNAGAPGPASSVTNFAPTIACIWARALSAAEILALHNDPYGFLEYPWDRIPHRSLPALNLTTSRYLAIEAGMSFDGAFAQFEALTRLNQGTLARDWSGDFGPDFGPSYGGGVPVEIPRSVAQPIRLPPLPATLPSHLALGLKNANTQLGWMTGSGVPWDYRYQYLTPSWKTFNSPNGQIVSNYLMQGYTTPGTQAYVPVFTVYEIEGQAFANEAAREAWIQNTSNMLGIYNDFQLLCQKITGAGGWDASRAGGGSNYSVSADNSVLTYTGSSGLDTIGPGATFRSAGKWIYSVTLGATPAGVGLADASAFTSAGHYPGIDTHSVGWFQTGGVLINGTTVTTIQAVASGVQLDVAADLDAKRVWFRTNAGNWNNSSSANPATGAGGIDISGLASMTLSPAVDPGETNNTATFNTPPSISGFSAWNIASPLAILHIEPDLAGFVEQNWGVGGGSLLTVSVASSGYTGVAGIAGLPNTFGGYVRALKLIRDAYAPSALLALHVSHWGPNNGYDPTNYGGPSPQATADQVAAFYAGLGGANYDLLFHDPSDADSAYKVLVRGNSIASAWWTIPSFASYQAYLLEACLKTQLRGFVWQIPVGNTKYLSCNNTAYHYQDNRPEYFLNSGSNANLLFYAVAGVVGLLFGDGQATSTDVYNNSGQAPYNPAPISDNNTGSTTSLTATLADDDGGGLQTWGGAYYSGGALALPPTGSDAAVELTTRQIADPSAAAEAAATQRIDPAAAPAESAALWHADWQAPAEAGARLAADAPPPGEAGRTQRADPPGGIEAPARIIGDAPPWAEAATTLRADPAPILECPVLCRIDPAAAAEFALSQPAVVVGAIVPLEWLLTGRRTGMLAESAALWRADATAPGESLQAQRVDPPVAAENTALYRLDIVSPAEAPSTARSDVAAALEALLAAARAGAPVEFALRLRCDPPGGLEASGTVRADPPAPAEAGGTCLARGPAALELLLAAARDGTPIEWLSLIPSLTITANGFAPIEWAALFRADPAAMAEIMARLAADTAIAMALGRVVTADPVANTYLQIEALMTTPPPIVYVAKDRLRAASDSLGGQARAFGPIAPGANDWFAFDFTAAVGAATIMSTSWTCALRPLQTVTDPQPQMHILAPATATTVIAIYEPAEAPGWPGVAAPPQGWAVARGSCSVALVGGFGPGTAGAFYELTATVVTSDGRTLTLSADLPVA
jgi:hypothetical protein